MELSKFTLEKLEIHNRLLIIEQYMKDGKDQQGQLNDTLSSINLRCKNVEYMIHGKSDSLDKIERDGMNRRIESLETKEEIADKIKNNFLKVAIGSITMAIGAFVLWVCKLIWFNMGK